VPARVCTPLALLGSSLAFGLVHDRWVAASLAGIAYGAVAVRRGSLGAAIVAHAVHQRHHRRVGSRHWRLVALDLTRNVREPVFCLRSASGRELGGANSASDRVLRDSERLPDAVAVSVTDPRRVD